MKNLFRLGFRFVAFASVLMAAFSTSAFAQEAAEAVAPQDQVIVPRAEQGDIPELVAAIAHFTGAIDGDGIPQMQPAVVVAHRCGIAPQAAGKA